MCYEYYLINWSDILLGRYRYIKMTFKKKFHYELSNLENQIKNEKCHQRTSQSRKLRVPIGMGIESIQLIVYFS